MKLISNPPPPPIGPRTTDVDAILNLQDVLLFLIDKGHLRMPDDERRDLVERARDDRRRKVYGTGTANVVSAFRKQFQLAAGESVDEPTAEVLNRLLRESGGVDIPAEGEWVVRGQVTDDSGPRDDIQVNVFDRDLFFRRELANTGQLLGTDVTKRIADGGAAGSFEIAYSTAAFAAGEYRATGAVAVDLVPDLVFALSKDGRSLDRLRILRQPDGDGIKEETEVSADELILGIQARQVETVHIAIIGGEARRALSEYERVWQAVESLLPEGAVAGADEASREALVGAAAARFDEAMHRDISFVVRETGLGPLLIEALRAAFRLAADPFEQHLPASVFYGLARTRGASDLLGLARLSTTDLRSALADATTGDVPLIPPFLPPQRLEETVQTIRGVLSRRLPDHHAGPGVPSLKDLVGADLPAADDQATLWRAHTDHTGTAAEFWEALGTQPGFGNPTLVAKLKYTFQLGVLARNNLELVNAIKAQHPAVTDTRELAFHLDTADKWQALLDAGAVPVPAGVPGKPEEQKANYASGLAMAMQVAHPTIVVANTLAAVATAHVGGVGAAVAALLAAAVRMADFDLATGRIDELLAEHGDTLLAPVAVNDRPVVIAQLKRLQRLFRLSVGPESIRALLEAGINSARELAQLPPLVAMDMLVPLVGEATSRLILTRAANITAAAVHQYSFLNDAMNGGIPRGAM